MIVKKYKLYFLFLACQVLNVDLSQATLNINNSKDCIITSYEKVFIPRKTPETKLKKAIRKTTCPKKINLMFLDLIKSAQGYFSTKNFQKLYLPKNIKTNVIIRPDQIKISSLETLIKTFKFRKSIIFKKIKKNNNLHVLTLDKKDQISLTCDECESPGEKLVIIKVKNSKKYIKKSIPVGIILLTQHEIITPKKNIDYFNNKKLFKSDFSKRLIETTTPSKYFKKFDKIMFYKPTRILKKDSPLLKRDLIPIKLVRSFTPVKIILSNKGINLTGIAIAKKSGHFGDIIPLKNKKGKRILFGKVIDFNKVKIEI